jgi:phage shock protein PspC (stress-responsive transcriptional regulator)
MNKTVTINISGIIFHIEEDAFERLSKYLGTIKGYFSRTDGGNEIMADIEARIAEMLQGKTSAVKQVVLMADVDYVMETMGKPEEFAGDQEQKTEEEQTHEYHDSGEPVKKRMFRDPDHKAIGGVCSGIAAYFDVDVVWIRLAMFLLIFFGGVSLWVYIILWIVIPEAKTTAEKLAMRGEKIDINNISKTVKEEAEQLKKRMEKYGNDVKNNSAGFRNDTRNFFDKLGDFIKEFFILFIKFFGRLIGLILLIFGVCFMFGLLTSIFGFSVAGTNAEFNDWINLVFLERSHYTIGVIGIILFVGIPVLTIIYGGVKLLFKIKYRNRWLNLSAGLIWLIGFMMVLYAGIYTGKDFNEGGKIKEQVQLVQHDTLYLTLNKSKEFKNSWAIDDDDDEHRGRHRRHVRISSHRDDYAIGRLGEARQIVGYATLNIVPSLTDNFELYVVKTARGEDKRSAMDRARAIGYKVSQKDSTVTFDEIFTVDPNEKFRVQQVEVILKVPRNKVIRLDKSLERFIYDVENVSNTFDAHMAGRRWYMSKEGLGCIDCEGIEADEETFGPPPPPAPPGVLDIKDKDANVKIDKDGINIKSKDGNVKIGKDGIHIDTKTDKTEKGASGKK